MYKMSLVMSYMGGQTMMFRADVVYVEACLREHHASWARRWL